MNKLLPPVYRGKKPTKIRRIPRKYASKRGLVRTTKLHLLNQRPPPAYAYESGLERDIYFYMDWDLNCVEIIPQSTITWIDEKGKRIKYSGDCWTLFYDYNDKNWTPILIEIKPSGTLRKLEQDDNWQQKIASIKKFCQELGWEFRIVTEEYVYPTRLVNIKHFRPSATIPPKKTPIKTVKEKLRTLYQKKTDYTFSDLETKIQQAVKGTLPITLVKRVLEYLLYYQELWFDWDEPFSPTDTLIYQNFNHVLALEPFYEIKPVMRDTTSIEAETIKSEFDLAKLTPQQKEEAIDRYEVIRPLLKLKREGKLTGEDIQNQADENGVTTRTIYRWLQREEEKGWKGLIAKDYKKGQRQSRLEPEVEEIIQKTIKEYMKNHTSYHDCWKTVHDECEERGYRPPSYRAIRRRIRKSPAKERKGKQGGFIKHEMSQTVQGQLHGNIKHPLEFIQMDHALLNIYLVDQINKKIRQRPYLTLGIDVRTRMIYTWFLDFKRPNSVTVAKAILRGFLPKDEEMKKFNIDLSFPIHGVPQTIEYDNAKEFDSRHVKEFCLLHGIENPQFREVKRPDRGAFVERMVRTIKDSWMRPLPGYFPRNRPEGIKPTKEAKMTFPEFEEWLIKQFVKYHYESHSGLEDEYGVERSPIEQYRLDMTHRKPFLPADSHLLPFEIYPAKTRKLRPEGINWGRCRYNNDGDSKKLLKIRARNQGETKTVVMRYDPEDVTSILVYDDVEREYVRVGVSGGVLKKFVDKYPGIAITLSEFQNIKKELKKKGQRETPDEVEKLVKAIKRIEEEIKKRPLRKSKKKDKTREPKSKEKTDEEQAISEDGREKKSMKTEIDWSTLKPAPKSKMARLKGD